MRAAQIVMRCLACMIIAMLMLPPEMPAQESGQPEQTDKFTKEELVQMLAPLALYPDSLVAQMLMASTYPLEVVEAERWMRQNKELKGDALDNALKEKTWDPSVKSLCHFPDVLFAMSEELDQTRKLGDAFLSQEEDVMATIQELRQKAEEQGTLKSTEEQKVIVEDNAIRIEPADPEAVYVPVYDPLYVYGPWWYPAYPPYYWYYPPGYYYTGGYIGFGFPIFIGFGWFSWSWFDWHHHHIYVDHRKTHRFHRHDRHRPDTVPVWRHNPRHRQGVAYRDSRTSARFGERSSRPSAASRERRGYPDRSIERRDGSPSQGPSERSERTVAPPERRERGEVRGPVERRGTTVAPKVQPGREKMQPPAGRDTPFRGIGNGNFERRASERGGISRQGLSGTRQSGGAVRQGGVSGGGVSRGGGGSSGRGGTGGSRR